MATLTTPLAAAWLAAFDDEVAEHADELTALDSAIGDADHGANMVRGLRAVRALAVGDFLDARSYLKKVGMTLVNSVGGAAGPLYGTFFLRLAGALPPGDEVAADELAAALRAGLQGVVDRGRASMGDKTMVDALTPAVDAFATSVRAGDDVGSAWRAAAAACAAGRDATRPLVARKGRASYLGERSAGHVDPGAASVTLLMEAAARTLGASSPVGVNGHR